MGMLCGSPAALVGLCTPYILRLCRAKGIVKLSSTRFTIYCIYVSAFSVLVLLAFLGFTIGRYTVDFAPEFAVLSWCLLAAWWQVLYGSPKGRPVPFRIAVVGMTLYSTALGVSMCILLSHYDGLCR
jgi:hypothetical protein